MGYVLKSFFGLAILAGSVTAAAYGISEFLQIGTCASGGPYVSARECPDDIELLFFVVAGGFIFSFVGTGLFAARGDPPGGAGSRRVSAAVLMWCATFLSISFACFWGVWGPDAEPGPGGELGGLIVAFLFALMGLAGLPMLLSGGKVYSVEGGLRSLSGLRTMVGRQQSGGVPSTPVSTPSSVATPSSMSTPSSFGAAPRGDQVARLERLQKLRADGAITESEFQQLKQKVIEGKS